MARTGGVWHARVDTRNFVFDCVAPSREQARDVLREAWRVHRDRTGATLTWPELVRGGDVQFRWMAFGSGYRDGEALVTGHP